MEMGEQLHSKHLIEHYVKLFTTLSEFKQNIRQISINVVYKNTNKCLWSIFFRSVEIKTKFMYLIGFMTLTQKIADQVGFRHFQGEGAEFFFKSDLTGPSSDF